MFNMDYYQRLDGRVVFIGGNTKIMNAEDICGPVLKQLVQEETGVTSIFLHQEFPAEVVRSIEAAFGTVYKENPEGYGVVVSEDEIHIYGQTRRSLLFGCYALQRAMQNGGVRCGIIYNYPRISVRGVKVFLPGENNIKFFKHFVEYCSFYGCNAITIEVGGAMEYKKHPEINEGWEEYCHIFEEYQGKTLDVQKMYGWRKNSIHFENGGGRWLTQEQVEDLVAFCRSYYLDVIPEVPSLSHSDYLLTRHPELAERQEDPLPNTYCPSNPATYTLLFDLLDETIEVFRPETINIAHDEFYSIGLCDRCKEKAADAIYADDINKIYEYLKARGIKTDMWGDKLLNAISAAGYRYGGSYIEYQDDKGNQYTVPATYPAIDKIPSDIRILNWYWRIDRKFDEAYFKRGFTVLYGNFRPMQIFDYRKRMDERIEGYFISNWSSLDPAHIQRNGIFAAVAYAANMFWNPDFDETDFKNNFMETAHAMQQYHYPAYHKGGYLKIVHTTEAMRPHKEFVDGYLMDYDGDYMGSYRLIYHDGSQEEHKIYFGLNIGCKTAEIGRKELADSDMYDLLPYFYEPSYTCGYQEAEDGLYYEMTIPLAPDKRIKEVKLTKGAEEIQIKEIYYINEKNIKTTIN